VMAESEAKKFQYPLGLISGIPIGSVFVSRMEMVNNRLHRPPMAGISYISNGPAESIVLSGGYIDDVDEGDRIIYTGQGGQERTGGRQVRDQELTRGNRALAISQELGTPIRMIRGSRSGSKYGPSIGFRFDGLFQVRKHWFEPSKEGPLVIRFELVKLEDEAEDELGSDHLVIRPVGKNFPDRKKSVSTRIVRSAEISAWVKSLYDNCCQFCGVQLQTPIGSYSEAAHIRPLGRPHSGADSTENILCLCPNCHIRFDKGAYYIDLDSTEFVDVLSGLRKSLTLHSSHQISREVVEHHKVHISGVR
jgi:putative restriction endonuclease